MKYLLDTCTFIWLCADPNRLSQTAIQAMEADGSELLFNDVSALEIGLKWQAGKIQLSDPPRHWIDTQLVTWGLQPCTISRDDIYRAGELPPHHRDPFDRLLVASALKHNATILTPDEAIREYPVSCRW